MNYRPVLRRATRPYEPTSQPCDWRSLRRQRFRAPQATFAGWRRCEVRSADGRRARPCRRRTSSTISSRMSSSWWPTSLRRRLPLSCASWSSTATWWWLQLLTLGSNDDDDDEDATPRFAVTLWLCCATSNRNDLQRSVVAKTIAVFSCAWNSARKCAVLNRYVTP